MGVAITLRNTQISKLNQVTVMRIENYFPGVYISVNTATAFTDSINLSNSQAEQKKRVSPE